MKQALARNISANRIHYWSCRGLGKRKFLSPHKPENQEPAIQLPSAKYASDQEAGGERPRVIKKPEAAPGQMVVFP